MDYPELSAEVKEEVARQFGFFDLPDDDFCIDCRHDGYYVTAKTEYDYVNFGGLRGLLKVADLLGCNEGDESDREYQRGCRTCDYGATYSVTFRFWKRQEPNQ